MKKSRTREEINIRIIASFVILIGAILLGRWPESEGNITPTKIQTVGAAIADCDRRSVNSAIGRLGCNRAKGVGGSGSINIVRVRK
ncbi:MAG TPA: hypothetical protein ENJ91_06335 [Rhodobacteraceae bacterium]|nr:hypothetical protein [Paracoccaceae bacterium]